MILNIIKDLVSNMLLSTSGVMDETKDFYELPRYPINEKYGEIKRLNL